MQFIQSKDNPRFKHWLKLSQSVKYQRSADRLMIEGLHLLLAWDSRVQGFDAIVLSESGLARREIAEFVKVQSENVNIYQLPDRLFSQLAEAQTPAGILAWVEYPKNASLIPNDVDTVLLDGLQDPGNVGTLLRTAAAAGIKQVLLSPNCCSAWSGKALRAGQGAQFVLDLFEQVDLTAFLDTFQGQSIATCLQDARNVYDSDAFASSVPLAWVFGSEGGGVSESVMACVQRKITVPMPGNVESLNVSAAAAVCLFEAVRRRLSVKGV